MSTETTVCTVIESAARSAAQGWAEQCGDNRSPWTADIPYFDFDWLRTEVLSRDTTEDEDALFERTFVAEYNAIMVKAQ